MYQTIDQLNIKERRVFIRVDYNTPLKNGKITDDTRIKESLQTIQYAITQGAKIILGTHLGRPKGVKNEKLSLLPVAQHLSALLKKDVIFTEDCFGDGVKHLAHELRPGEIMLLENLRFHPEEEANDAKFSEYLSQLAEVYVSDAFGVIHRAHASTCGMVSFFKEKGIGFLIQKELKALDQLLNKPEKPFVAILGGAKVSDKIGVIENLMNYVDGFVIGGGMAYTFLKAQGFDVGTSMVDDTKIHHALKLLERAKVKGIEILLPSDSVLASEIAESIPTRIGKNGDDWQALKGLDIGPETIEKFSNFIRRAKTVFWNGPMGVFENPLFSNGTSSLALAVGETKALSVVGGGDSVSAIKQSGYADRVTHLCTGGGAALEYLEGKVLPGLKVLQTI